MMMYEVLYKRKAIDYLEERKNNKALLSALEAVEKQLENNPYLHHSPSLNKNNIFLRTQLTENYCITYRVDEKNSTVIIEKIE